VIACRKGCARAVTLIAASMDRHCANILPLA
jgi:hypothetical protein